MNLFSKKIIVINVKTPFMIKRGFRFVVKQNNMVYALRLIFFSSSST